MCKPRNSKLTEKGNTYKTEQNLTKAGIGAEEHFPLILPDLPKAQGGLSPTLQGGNGQAIDQKSQRPHTRPFCKQWAIPGLVVHTGGVEGCHESMAFVGQISTGDVLIPKHNKGK